MKKQIFSLALCGLMFFISCDTKPVKQDPLDMQLAALDLPSSVESDFRKSAALLDALTMTMKSYELTATDDDYLQLAKTYEEMVFLYDADGLSDEGRKACATQKYRIDSARTVARQILTDNLPEYRKLLVCEEDKLIEETMEYPVYLPKGTRLHILFETDGTATTRLLNADSRSTIRTWTNKKRIHDSVTINNSAIYLVEVVPKGNPYISLTLERNCKNIQDVTKQYEVNEEEVPCKPGDFLARKVDGITINNLFEEPHKVTLRSQGKAIFTGGTRSVVAMQVPANSTDIVYSLRISTSESDQSTDGQFCKKANEKYKEIKFLGLPIYESHGTSSNIFRELLNASEPPREEEAYCNLYVFTSAEEAKKFSDGKMTTRLDYNIDFSKQGTQSCTDRIPTKGNRTLYFGFENTRMRYSVYLWLESFSTAKKTEYFKTKYTIDQ